MKKLATLAFLSFAVANSIFSQNNDGFPVLAKVENGFIEGNYDTRTGIQKYFGIPFAKPPVGDLRWKAPQPADNWQGIKQTKQFGPRPMQKLIWNDMHSRSNGVSEDCLYLNVWTPAKRNTKDLPVLVYFYGGGFVAGDGSEPRYDGEHMAQEGIVVVTCNYRLNIFGFFAHPELSAEATYESSGNYGLLDQAFALQWVRRNIATFGGDPRKVTICGESAGSVSVSYHMASPLSRPLIAGAIGESGAGIPPTLAPVPQSEAENIGAEFAKNAGYPSIEELRALPARDIYEIYIESGRFGFPVVLDDYFLPKQLPQIFAAREQAQVPLLLGWNTAEMPGQAFMQGQPYTPEAFANRVKAEYPNDYEEVMKLYPSKDAREVELSATALAADRFISYATWKWGDLHLKNSSQPVYRYLYSKLRPTAVPTGPSYGPAMPPQPAPVGAPHACEIEYCMGNLPLIHDFAWTVDDYKVSETMMKYFANFIKTGNPNGEKLPEWPAQKAADPAPSVMILNTESKAEKAVNDGRYRFLDKAYGNN